MKPFVALSLTLLLAGCVARPGASKKDAGNAPATQAEADRSIDGIRVALAEVADEMAEKAAEFKSWEDFYAGWSKRNEDCQPPKFLPWTNSLNERFGFEKLADGTVKATKDYDPKLAAEVARESAKGFRGK